MKEYAICQLEGKEYNGFLLCLTFESILTYLKNIEEESIISNSKGTLLIDQILVTGNGKNRFVICSFDYGVINIHSAKNVLPSEWYKKLSVNLLQENFALLHNSILTDQQKENVKQGIIF